MQLRMVVKRKRKATAPHAVSKRERLSSEQVVSCDDDNDGISGEEDLKEERRERHHHIIEHHQKPLQPCVGSLANSPVIKAKLSLPESYIDQCHICSTTTTAANDGNDELMRIIFRLKIDTKEEALEFLKKYSVSSYVTWRHTRSDPRNMAKGTKNLFWAIYHCQSSSRKVKSSTKTPHKKHTDCPARMKITVKRIPKRCRSSDVHLPIYPTTVDIVCTHNHEVICLETLQYRDVSDETKKKFLQLYKAGHRPATALKVHKRDLQVMHGDAFEMAASDRSICPDIQWCHRLYSYMLKSEYANYGEEAVSMLTKRINLLNEKWKMECCKLKSLESGRHLVVALCTPLMKRAHKYLAHSGQTIFVDTSGSVDKYNRKVYLLLTHSCIGGLPLGLIITTTTSTTATFSSASALSSADTTSANASITASLLTSGLELYKSLLSDDSFCGSGPNGPSVILVGDSVDERASFATCFPNSITLLCVFQLLQSVWRFLWDPKQRIAASDCQHLLSLVDTIVHSQNEFALQLAYYQAINDPVALKYPNYLLHLQRMWSQREIWAICIRQSLLSENHGGNFADPAMRVMREKIFLVTRSQTLLQLINFVATRLEQYYKDVLVNAVNNLIDVTARASLLPRDYSSSMFNITQKDEVMFEVKNNTSGKVHVVNMNLGACSCLTGLRDWGCKHLNAVIRKHNFPSFNFVQFEDETARATYLQIGTETDFGLTDEDHLLLAGRTKEARSARELLSAENVDHSIPIEQLDFSANTASVGLEEDGHSVHQFDGKNKDFNSSLTNHSEGGEGVSAAAVVTSIKVDGNVVGVDEREREEGSEEEVSEDVGEDEMEGSSVDVACNHDSTLAAELVLIAIPSSSVVDPSPKLPCPFVPLSDPLQDDELPLINETDIGFLSKCLDIEDMEQKIHAFADRVIKKLHQKPELYADGVSTFLRNADEMHSDSTLLAALFTFGK